MRVVLLIALSLPLCHNAYAEDRQPLEIEAKIALGDVKGRIDHIAIDISRRRLFIAELGNNSVGVIDVAARKLIRTMTGFDEPQGLAHAEATDTLYVANGGDGSLRIFHGPELSPAGTLKLGTDADNVRISTDNRVLVGYGSGAIAVVDPTTQKRIADIPLKAHPESFQIESSGSRIFVNVPNSHEIAVLDRTTNKQISSWGSELRFANFPMALDEESHRLLVVFRHPAVLAAYETGSGALITKTDTCGDSDDVFIDTKRQRVYVICGEGVVDVLSSRDDVYSRTMRLKIVLGARTGLFVPALDELFVAVRSSGAEPAFVWVIRPLD